MVCTLLDAVARVCESIRAGGAASPAFSLAHTCGQHPGRTPASLMLPPTAFSHYSVHSVILRLPEMHNNTVFSRSQIL